MDKAGDLFITVRHAILSDKKSEPLNFLQRLTEGSWFLGDMDEKGEIDKVQVEMYSYNKEAQYSVLSRCSGISTTSLSVSYGNSVLDITYERKKVNDMMSPYFLTGGKPDIFVLHDNRDRDIYAITLPPTFCNFYHIIAASFLLELAVKRYNIVNELKMAVSGHIASGDMIFDNVTSFTYLQQSVEYEKMQCDADIEIDDYDKKIEIYNFRDKRGVPPFDIKPKEKNIYTIPSVPVLKINGVEPRLKDGWEIHLLENNVDFKI